MLLCGAISTRGAHCARSGLLQGAPVTAPMREPDPAAKSSSGAAVPLVGEDLLNRLSEIAREARQQAEGEAEDGLAPPAVDQFALLGLDASPKTEWRRLPKIIWLATALVWTSARQRALVIGILQTVAGLGLGAQLLAGNNLLQQAIQQRAAGGQLSDLIPNAAAVAVISAVVALATSVAAAQQPVISELVATHAYAKVMAASGAVDLVEFEDSTFYDRLQRAAAGAQMRPWMLATHLLMMVASSLGSIGIGVALAALSPLLLVLGLASAVPVWFATARNAQSGFRVMVQNTPDDRERGYLRSLLTGRDAAKEVRAFGLVGFLRQRHDSASQRIIERHSREARHQLRRTLAGRFGGGTATAVTGGALLWLLVTGRLPIAAAITAAIGIQELRKRTAALATSGAGIFENGLYLYDYAAFVDMVSIEGKDHDRGTLPPFEVLRAEEVTFRYPGSAVAAVDAVDVEIRAGEVVAFVGENGSGKTTLAKLLCGLYEPTSGRIRWDAVSVAGFPEQMREHVAVIFQDFVRYAFTARENIALGRHEHLQDEDRLRLAAQLAGVDDIFERLPRGWETVLGPQFAGGQDLSGGQWQRVALARAFFRDAPFLVLDEPTAALDPRAEFRLFERLRDAARGRAVLLITHRFTNVRMADRIYVLHDGRVAESGTHEELLATGGRYAQLFSLQAAQLLGLDDSATAEGSPARRRRRERRDRIAAEAASRTATGDRAASTRGRSAPSSPS